MEPISQTNTAALAMIGSFSNTILPANKIQGTLTEDKAAEQAYAAAHNGAVVKVLNEGAYQITVTPNGEKGDEVIIHDTSGNALDTTVWGDPHVISGDGSQWSFKGNVDFTLQDGTHVVVKTTPWSASPNQYVISSVEITNQFSHVTIGGMDSAVNLNHNGITNTALTGGTIIAGDDASSYAGVAHVQMQKDGGWGYMDANGKVVDTDNGLGAGNYMQDWHNL